MNNDFNAFLQDKHKETYQGTEDDRPDAFSLWILRLDPEEWVTYAEEWCASLLKHN